MFYVLQYALFRQGIGFDQTTGFFFAEKIDSLIGRLWDFFLSKGRWGEYSSVCSLLFMSVLSLGCFVILFLQLIMVLRLRKFISKKESTLHSTTMKRILDSIPDESVTDKEKDLYVERIRIQNLELRWL